jgi:phage tail sheath protein FI
MTVQVSYPGVYLEELPSSTQVVTGVSTSSTAFVDYFARGPVAVFLGEGTASPTYQLPYQINNWSDFQRLYGGLDHDSESTYGAMQFFLNGGQVAWIVRVVSADTAAASCTSAATVVTAAAPSSPVSPLPPTLALLSAANPGAWGNNLQATVSPPALPVSGGTVYNLIIQEMNGTQVVNSESYLNLNWNPASANYAPAMINAVSQLVYCAPPAAGETLAAITQAITGTFSGGADGAIPGPGALAGAVFQDGGPLDRIAPALFNILCMPATAKAGVSPGEMSSAITTALQYCQPRRAFMIVDIPQTIATVTAMQTWAQSYVLNADNYSGAVYFPRLVIPDPINSYRNLNVAASGTLAGVYARTDASVGVWTAPAGTTASLMGATVAVPVTDAQDGQLNPLGVNALRTFPVFGNISWGARTLAGADQIGSQWKYIPVRRLVDYIEMSLVQSLKWVVFQPNDSALWASIRLEVGNFLAGLYSQGALFGATAAQAYFVNCDETTTTPTDIAQGIVNIVVGIAPVTPAEFVILQIQQIAGQTS